MSVYVDSLREYLQKIKGSNKWCHLVADNLSELESFARKLNLSPNWFQANSYPHYDLTEGKRIQAVKLGAVEIDDKEFVALIRKNKEY